MVANFYDVAALYNQTPGDVTHQEEMQRLFESMLNSPEDRKLILHGEAPVRTEEEEVIIKEVKNIVVEQMLSFDRNVKDVPLDLIHVVSAGKKAKCSSMFLRGIVVEKSDESLFRVELYYELFYRMSYSVIATDYNRKIFLVDDGLNVLKRGLATHKTREFAKKLFVDESVLDRIVDTSSEEIFLHYLEEYENNSNFSREEAMDCFSKAIVNGTVFLLIELSRGKVLDPGESIVLLNWLRMIT